MAKSKKAKADEDFLLSIKDNYRTSVDQWDHIYTAAEDDIRFVYDVDGGQWPSAERDRRTAAGRPVITSNKILKFVRQLRGDMMMNRPRIKVIPVDDKSDPQMAELYNGLIRQIEYLSSAEIVYDTAYMAAVSCSIGFFRLVTQYESDESFDQIIRLKRIVNPLSVHFDPMALEFTLEDARYCFIEEMVEKKMFEKLYPSADATAFAGDASLIGDWDTGENIRVAEYFYKEPEKKTIVQLETGDRIGLGGKVTKEYIQSKGGRIVKERTVDTHKVMWCKTNGYELLEEPKEWVGSNIPIIPVFGDEIVVGGKRYYLSHTRGAKGPQTMYNYWATAATENVALTPKNPYVVDHRQIKGFENEWNEANLENRMFIRYNAIAGLDKPHKEPQSQVPAAIISMMQSTAYDIEDHLGRYESSKGEAGNERSGKAIIARIAQSDKGTYTFVNNLARAIVYAGRQMIEMIPKIYDTPRALSIMGEDGQQKTVKVNQPVPMAGGEGVGIANDLSVGTYDLIATAGASYSSKRQEMTAMMIESLQYAPQLANVIAPLIFKYSDYPGAEEVYAEVKKQMEAAQQQAQQGQPQPQGQPK
uniref:Putative P22-like portal protein n=1 Tax=viral metagenome TaxID=1070528 RepID=A0A6H1ZDX5_9ZZZZ